ncbi:hypothetical protein [Psychrobium sp. 1_MG-2023]|uniref:hypothetical protein n=1 Tax=Psychrobium sp. 1_MG-2023 TaxID=3062624 RepID=UPI002734BB8C|nr:hypothetical protein [Psychrobium sp. 1_MG-2023]MDP2562050.1 hypothetical protein [Psychrobium sp. 1_MG-2023]
MKKTTKAVVLSIVVFPGAGHIFLKRYKTAALFLGIFGAAAVMIISNILSRAQLIADRIIAGEIPPDFTTILQEVAKQSEVYSSHHQTIISFSLLILWQLCTFDAYRCAKRPLNLNE